MVSGALLIIYAIMIRSAVLTIHPSEIVPEGTGILTSLIYAYIGSTGLIPDLISIGLIFFNAIIINYLVAHNFLAREINLFPGLFYIIVSSVIPDFLSLSGIHFANTFLLFASLSIFEIYKKNSIAGYIFNAGLLIGISSLFNYSYSIFFIWLLIATTSFHTLKFKYFFSILTGFAIPWIYTFLYYFWHGKVDILLSEHLLNQFKFLTYNFTSSISAFLAVGLFVLLFLVVLFNFNKNFQKQKFEAKKKIALLYWMILIGLLFLTTGTGVGYEQLLVLSVPVGILLSLTFTRMKAPFDGLYHFLLLIFVVLLQYLTFLDII